MNENGKHGATLSLLPQFLLKDELGKTKTNTSCLLMYKSSTGKTLYFTAPADTKNQLKQAGLELEWDEQTDPNHPLKLTLKETTTLTDEQEMQLALHFYKLDAKAKKFGKLGKKNPYSLFAKN